MFLSDFFPTQRGENSMCLGVQWWIMKTPQTSRAHVWKFVCWEVRFENSPSAYLKYTSINRDGFRGKYDLCVNIAVIYLETVQHFLKRARSQNISTLMYFPHLYSRYLWMCFLPVAAQSFAWFYVFLSSSSSKEFRVLFISSHILTLQITTLESKAGLRNSDCPKFTWVASWLGKDLNPDLPILVRYTLLNTFSPSLKVHT